MMKYVSKLKKKLFAVFCDTLSVLLSYSFDMTPYKKHTYFESVKCIFKFTLKIF